MKSLAYDMVNKYFIDLIDSSGNRIPVYMSIGNHESLINYEPLVVNEYSPTSGYKKIKFKFYF